MTSRLKIIFGGILVVLIAFGVWSYLGKVQAQKQALISDGRVEVLKGQLDKSVAETQVVIKEKDEIIKKAEEAKKKVDAQVLAAQKEKEAISAQYGALLGQIATKPPDEVVAGINGFIGPEARLLSMGSIEFSMVGGRSTLRLFTEGKRDVELFIKEQNKSKGLADANSELSTQVGALKSQVTNLTLSLNKCTDETVPALMKSRDDWRTAAQRSFGWEKIERAGMVIVVVAFVLKILKVF